MKIVVIGGSGLIGRHLTAELSRQGHEAIAASPSSGVNALTGEGLAKVLAGADVVVDVSNSPSFEDAGGARLLRALWPQPPRRGARSGCETSRRPIHRRHERLEGNGYFLAKVAQERLIAASDLPYTVVRATQFFEFVATIAQASVAGDRIVVPDADFQPIAAPM